MLVKAIKEFVEFLPGMKTNLKEIQFFDKSDEMTQLVHNNYQMANGAGERYLSPESVLMQVYQSPTYTKPTSHNNGSHSTNPRLNPGQQHFQNPYGQASSNQPQPSPLTYQSSPNFSPQSKTSAAATRCVSSNWTCIGKIDGADTFNINKLHVLIYTSDLPYLNNVDILVSTENSQGPGKGKLAKAILKNAGEEYRKEHEKLFSGKKKLNNGEIKQTGAGRLHYKVVLHAIIDKFPDASPAQYHLDMLYNTTFHLLDIANKKKEKKKQMLTIALPLLGAGKCF